MGRQFLDARDRNYENSTVFFEALYAINNITSFCEKMAEIAIETEITAQSNFFAEVN